MELFYKEDIRHSQDKQHFNSQESKHICQVLRKERGGILNVTDGRGNIFEVTITEPHTKKCEFHVHSHKTISKNRDYNIHLAVAPTKSNERFGWFVEKACELGIDRITPIQCQLSEKKRFNKERVQKIAVSALKQSAQCYLAEICDLINFDRFIKHPHPPQRYIACCGGISGKSPLSKAVKPLQDTLVLIGPEGDFSEQEITLALQNGFIPISLGQARLRTESAAVFACHTIHIKNELFS